MADHEYEIIEPGFMFCVNMSSKVEPLFDKCIWAEGPVYSPAHRSLVWSDIPNNRMLRLDELTGNVGVFREPSGFSNGNTLDREGRMISCLQGERSVVRTEHDGSITTLVDSYEGKRLNSPNDVVVKSDGSIWFTCPSSKKVGTFQS